MSGETVTALRAPELAERDRYGNVVRDWADAVETDIDGVAVAPRYFTGSVREETSGGRQGVIVGLTVYLPPGVEIQPKTPYAGVLPTDRMRVRGAVYEVDGEPGVWVDPHTQTGRGVEVALRRVKG